MSEDFGPSQLGTKDYWDRIYVRDIENHKDNGDHGEIWFGEQVEWSMVKWISSNVDPDSAILELGCGNGHLLQELFEEGFRNLIGVDYSEPGIQLARSLVDDCIDVKVWDILETLPVDRVDLIVDKGTFDAISLSPDEQGKRDNNAIQKYIRVVTDKVIIEQCMFMITSCNWTEEELIKHFKDLSVKTKLKHSTFKFGGVQGSTVTTLIFQS